MQPPIDGCDLCKHKSYNAYTTCSVCTPDTQHIPHVHTFNNAGLQLAAVPAPEHDVNMTDMTYCMFKEEHINLQCESHL